ncbi:MAG: hypothetical protein DWI00_18010 [Planctomycetota bacterium]|nr:MAG: hypothetical protein DWI00_18010 [Planctomycetota bacterium]
MEIDRQENEGKRMKPGTMPNLFSFCCLHSLAIEESTVDTRLSHSDQEPAMMVLWKLTDKRMKTRE